MDVILRQDVDKVGTAGEMVTVKDGFARNFLLPQGLAYLATEGNKKRLAAEHAQKGRKHAALRKHEPPEQVGIRRLVLDRGVTVLDGDGLGLAHRPNQISTAPMTSDAMSHIPNCERTIRRDGTGLSRTLK